MGTRFAIGDQGVNKRFEMSLIAQTNLHHDILVSGNPKTIDHLWIVPDILKKGFELTDERPQADNSVQLKTKMIGIQHGTVSSYNSLLLHLSDALGNGRTRKPDLASYVRVRGPGVIL
jgi:hypothetical protein